MTKVSSTPYLYDQSIRPQDDFFGYVNSPWLQTHPIPDSETRWGIFNELRDQAWRHLRQIYEELFDHTMHEGSIEQKARDFYYTGIHMDRFTDEHMDLVRSMLQKVDGLSNSTALSQLLGELHGMKIGGPWYTHIDADDKDSTRHILRFCQGGLTLPDRDYYLDDNKKMQSIRRAYEVHVKEVHRHFPELGKAPNAVWRALYKFEYDIANISRSSVALRDIEKNYNKHSFSEVKKIYPHIDWTTYADALGWQSRKNISIDQPEFMAYVNDQLATRSLDDWKVYLKWHIIIACYGKVSSELSQLKFEFFGKVLGGATAIMPLWKRVVLAIDAGMGDAVGRLYAERFFPESSKQQVLSLVEMVRDTYAARIVQLDWMSDDTKAYALKKLANIKVLIGYPDEWRDFAGLEIGRTSYLGNSLAAAHFQKAYWLERLDQPTSREDWFMYPQTVNAYHDPNRLVICFPAAILQAPFFDPAAALAANMGGIGTVIGHELTHGFDDQGCQFDAEGNVRTWQTNKERQAFSQKAQLIIDQADSFEVLPGLYLKGGLIIGESIADLGGIEIAFEALRAQLVEDQTAKEKRAAEQLFYINYAKTECSATREEKLREYALSDPHPPAPFRVNGMLSHCDDFCRVFNVTETDKLYRPPDERAKIW